MAVLLKTASVRVSSIQSRQVRVQNKGKSVWKSRYDGDVSLRSVESQGAHEAGGTPQGARPAPSWTGCGPPDADSFARIFH